MKLIALCAAACVAGLSCTPADRRPPPVGGPTLRPTSTPSAGGTGIALRPMAEGFTAPLQVTHAGDGSGRLFVVEQEGVVRLVDPQGAVEPGPFLDLRGSVRSGGEQGLLGLAFHPGYETNGRLFVNYTDLQGDTVIAEYHAAPDAAVADAGRPRVLLTVPQPFPNHNGGGVAFGPDGYLYIGLGDGGSAGDPHENAQDLGSLLGKLLRVDVDRTTGERPYAIPLDNPFVERAGARPEIWAYGLRNPWRFSFDVAAATIWIGDIGQNELEEIHRSSASEAGVNYGWDVMEGSACFEPPSGCDAAGLALPVAEYAHGDDDCSVTGGYVYRGDDAPGLRGLYVFGDYCSGVIRAIDAPARGPQRPLELLDTEMSISSFGEDEDGELYVTDLIAGTVMRFEGRG
ncbi:MAG: sorbosone dehydrogenase family protein [Actinomycetota bacterium]